jgi:hypothetical protein
LPPERTPSQGLRVLDFGSWVAWEGRVENGGEGVEEVVLRGHELDLASGVAGEDGGGGVEGGGDDFDAAVWGWEAV